MQLSGEATTDGRSSNEVHMLPDTYSLDATWRTLLKDLGVTPANVLRRAGLADDLLQQPSTRLRPEQYYRLWDSIEAEMSDPLLPLRLCEAVRSESFSPPLFASCAAQICSWLRSASRNTSP